MKIGGFFIVAVLALTACSGDPQPREPDPSATPTSMSTATPPPMPDQATEDSPEGAAAFVIYWVDTLNHAARTGNTSALSQASSTSCAGCASYINELSEDPADARRPTDDFWKLSSVDVGESRQPILVRTEASVRTGSSDSKFVFEFELTPSAPFKVNDLVIVEQP